MQHKEAKELQKKWGNKPCTHTSLTKETFLGAQTGDYVCTTCGESGWGSDWPKYDNRIQMNIMPKKSGT